MVITAKKKFYVSYRKALTLIITTVFGNTHIIRIGRLFKYLAFPFLSKAAKLNINMTLS